MPALSVNSSQPNSPRINTLLSNLNHLSSSFELRKSGSITEEPSHGSQQKTRARNDPQMLLARLRYLQNFAAMNRAESELKRQRRTILYGKTMPTSRSSLQGETYQQICESSLQGSLQGGHAVDIKVEPEDDESDQDERGPEGVRYYAALKKHPKLLDHTLAKIDHKRKGLSQQEHLNDLKQQIRAGSCIELLEDTSFASLANRGAEATANQTGRGLAEKHFLRLFSKNTKGESLHPKAKESELANRILRRQDNILYEIATKQRSLSKEGKSKLQRRFYEIANDLGRHDKKYTNVRLPRLHRNPEEVVGGGEEDSSVV